MPNQIDKSKMTDAEWREKRRCAIGGSDIASIMGLDSYRSILELYLQKIGEMDSNIDSTGIDETAISIDLGHYLEPWCAKKFAVWFKKEYEQDIEVKEEPNILVSEKCAYHIANIDRWFLDPEHDFKERAGLEIKTSGEYSKDEWEDDMMPEAAYLQIQWYYLVTGYPRFFVVYLLGNRLFNAKYVPRNDNVINLLIKAVDDFWNKCIIPLAPPMPDGSASARKALGVMYSEDGKTEPMNFDDMQNDYDTYKVINQQIKELQFELEKIKQKYMARMGNDTFALTGGKKILWRTINRKGYEVQPNTYRQFNIY